MNRHETEAEEATAMTARLVAISEASGGDRATVEKAIDSEIGAARLRASVRRAYPSYTAEQVRTFVRGR